MKGGFIALINVAGKEMNRKTGLMQTYSKTKHKPDEAFSYSALLFHVLSIVLPLTSAWAGYQPEGKSKG